MANPCSICPERWALAPRMPREFYQRKCIVGSYTLAMIVRTRLLVGEGIYFKGT
jgi:hypothetical protein